MSKRKAFGLWSAVFLGIGSMVGVGIFIVVGEAGSVAGNIVWLSFVLGGLVALLSGYSLAKLALAFPSRGGIVEYLVQCYGEGFFSGTASVLFYLAQIVALAAIAKAFGSYAATFLSSSSPFWVNLFALGILFIFMVINLLGASSVAKSETVIVVIKLSILTIFTVAGFFFIKPEYLSLKEMPPLINMLYAIGITFFAYQGFSFITNTVEDMENPEKNIIRAMIISIGAVAVLYVAISVVVLGNLPLQEVLKAKDYALAEAVKPMFGEIGFKLMAATALFSTISAINATLYAVAEIGYTMAKKGELPKIYEFNVFNSYEGLIVSTLLTIPLIVFFDLSEITVIASLVVLIVQGLVHLGHFFVIDKTKANPVMLTFALVATFGITVLTLIYTYHKMPAVGYWLIFSVAAAFVLEAALRYFTGRVVSKQS